MTHQANNQKMMKMRFNILTTLVLLFTLAVGQSWGAEEEIFSYSIDENMSSNNVDANLTHTSAYLLEKDASGTIGGKIGFYVTGNAPGSTGCFESAQRKGKWSYVVATNSAYIKLQLPEGESFKSGDVIKFNAFSTSADVDRTLCVCATTSRSTTYQAAPGTVANAWTENSYTLTEVHNGLRELYLFRNKTAYINTITVTREVTPPYPTKTFDFQHWPTDDATIALDGSHTVKVWSAASSGVVNASYIARPYSLGGYFAFQSSYDEDPTNHKGTWIRVSGSTVGNYGLRNNSANRGTTILGLKKGDVVTFTGTGLSEEMFRTTPDAGSAAGSCTVSMNGTTGATVTMTSDGNLDFILTSGTNLVYSITLPEKPTPTITTDVNASYAAVVGQQLDLTIAATDAASYQWYSNTTNSNKGGTLLTGETNATLSITPTEVGTTYYYCLVKASTGTIVPSTVATVTAKAPLVWKDIAMDLRTDNLAKSNVANYIVIDNEGNVTTTTTDPGNDNPVIKVNSFNGDQHGYTNMDFTAPVPAGIYHIQLGNCQYNKTNKYAITTADGSVNKSVDATKSCDNTGVGKFDQHTDVYININKETALNIKMPNGYTPYFSITKQNEEPTDVQVYYSLGSTGAEGTLPASTSFAKAGTYTLPAKNYTLYKEGYTLTGWNDGTTTYALGAEYTHSKDDYDVTFTPVFTENAVSLENRTQEVVVNWDCRKTYEVGLNIQEGKGIFVTQATVADGKTIDVKLDVDATTGRFGSHNSSWAKGNEGAKFKVPSVNGTTIKMKTYSALSTTTFDGSTDYTSASNVATYNVISNNNPVEIVLGSDMSDGYIEYIQVTLPYTPRVATPTITDDGNGTVTIACETDGATIHYTTDGSDPTVESTTYSEPFTLTETKTVKAIAVKDGMNDSEVATKVVTIAEGEFTFRSFTYDFTNSSWLTADQKNMVTIATVDGNPFSVGPTYSYGIIVNENGSLTKCASNDANRVATVSGRYHNGGHGDYAAELQVRVDGPVKITVAGCAYYNPTKQPSEVFTTIKDGETLLATLYTQGEGKAAENVCGVPYIYEYQGGPTTLTITNAYGFTPSITVEAIEPVVHTWDFTKWSDATKTQVCGASDWTTKENDSKNYITGDQVRFIDQVNKDSDGNLKANGAVIAELEGLHYDNGLAQYGLAIAFDYKTLLDGNQDKGWGPYAGASYLWVTKSASKIIIPNVKAGSTFKLASESHKYLPSNLADANARGFKVSYNGTDLTSTSGTNTSQALTEFTYEIPENANGYADVVLEATAGCHLYWIDAETVEPPMEWRDIKLNLMNSAFLSESEKGQNVTFGIAVDEGGVATRVATDASDCRAVITGKDHQDVHGYQNFSMTVPVQGPVKVTVGACGWGGNGTIKIGDRTIASFSNKITNEADCYHGNTAANIVSALYEENEPATLTISGFGYVPYIAVESYNPVNPTAAGYYEVSNLEELKTAIAKVNASNADSKSDRSMIFIKNGTYDFGSDIHVAITGHNISFIGESQNGVILKTAPSRDIEGLTSASFIALTGTGCYFQDLTLQNNLDYYGALTAGKEGGRAGVIWDKGDKTVYKNVRLLSYQDTYYSNNSGKSTYFEGGEIHGTVDYICGSGNVFFKNVLLYNESRSATGKSGECTITAQNREANAESDKGYVFDGCTIESNCKTFNFGRSWHHARTVFMNTKVNSGSLIATHWDLAGMNSAADGYYEYNTKDASGNALVPSNWTMTFRHSTGNNTINTKLDAAGAANYSLANFFSTWDPTALTAQASTEGTVQDGSVLTFPAEGTYLIEKDGNFVAIVHGTSYTMPDDGKYTVRRANTMGGFGPKSDVYTTKQGEMTWSDFEIDLTKDNGSWDDYTYFVSDGKGGLTRSGASESHYLVKMKGAPYSGGADHGYANFVAEFRVPGNSKIYVGGCQYGSGKAYIKNGETIIKELDTNSPGCYGKGGSSATYDYEGGEATLTVVGATYSPYLKVECKIDIPVAEGKWIRYKNQDFENAEKIDDNWTTSTAGRYKSTQTVRSGDNHYVLYNAEGTNGATLTYDGIPTVGSKYTEAEVYKVEFDAGIVPVNGASNSTDATQSFKIYDIENNVLCDWSLFIPNHTAPKDTDGDIKIGGESVAKFTATRPTPTFYHIEIVGGTPAGTTMKVTDANGNVNIYTLSPNAVKVGKFTYDTQKSAGGLALDNLKVLVYNDIPEYTIDLPTETVEAKTGFRTKLSADAEGAVGYQWYKNAEASLTGGEPIDGATDMTYSFIPTEEGTEYYYVKAWNKFGTTVSHLATVNITKAIPEITKLEFGSFDFSKKKFKVNVEGVGSIHLSFDGGDYVDYDEEDQSNVYALNRVTAYATTSDGQSLPVVLTQPIEYDANKPFAAWIYTKSYVNSTTKAELEHEAQNQPITRKIREICNLINVEFPDESKVYGATHPSLNRADLIVFSEMVVGGTTLANSFEPLIGNVPFLNFKAYNYGKSTHRWEWGDPGQEDDYTAIAVNASNPWLKMFDGVKIIDRSEEPSTDTYGAPVFEICDKSNGAWNDAIKHLQWIDGSSLSNTLPTGKPATTFTNYAEVDNNKIFMHGFNPVAGGENVDALAPYILFALNFDNAQAVSDDAITIAGNLARMMLNNESFDTKTSGVAPTITDNGDGSAHISTNIYKGTIYYKVVAAEAAAPETVDESWTVVDAEYNTVKQTVGDWKVYAAVKFPSGLTGQPDGFAPTGYSQIGEGALTGTNIRIIKFAEGTEDILDGDEANHKYVVPSKYSILSKGAEVDINADYKIPMNVYMVKAEPGKEDEPVRPYYRFAGWTADQAVTAMTRNDRPADFDPLNPTYPIPYDNPNSKGNPKPAGTLLGTTTFVKMPENDLTFTSEFYKNKVSLNHASAPTLVTWDFTTNGVLYDRIDNGNKTYTEGPEYTQSHLGNDVWPSEPMNVENDAYYYNRLAHVLDLRYPDEMSQLDFSYRYIDVPLFMDSRNVTGANNQIFNVSYNNTASADYAKTTDRMIFGIPAVYGMQIKLIGNNSEGKVTTFTKETSKTTVGGEVVSAAEHKLLSNIQNTQDTKGNNPLLTMTYLGKDDYLYVDLNEGENNGEIYMKGISVIYPARVNITPEVKLGDAVSAEAGKIYYKPVAEEVELTEATPFSVGVADTLVAKAAYGYQFVGWYDGATLISDGVTDVTKDGKNNVIESQLIYTPSEGKTITAKFALIDKVKVQITTYRNTPADDKSAETTVNDDKEYGTFTFSTTQLGETVEFTPTYTNGAYEIEATPGTELTIHAIQVPGNRFNHLSKWTLDGDVWTENEQSIIRENPLTMTVDNATTKYYVQFEDVSGGFIVKYNSDSATDIVPSQNGMFNFASPRYHTLYAEGKSLLGWKDAKDNKYFIYQFEKIGSNAVETGQVRDELPLLPKETVSMDDDLVLTPIFANNNSYSKLLGRKATTTVTWDFTTTNRAQLLSFAANQTGKYVTRAAVKARDDKFYSCDVPLTFSTGAKGRINNTTSATWCSMGSGTKLTVPVCKGATITLDVRNKITSTTFAGEVPTNVMVQYRGSDAFATLDPENKTAIDCYRYSYTYQGDEDEADIVIGGDYSYYRKLSVTLPAVEQKHEVTLMYSDLTDLASTYNYSYSNKKATFKTLSTNETITMDLGSVNVYPTSTMAASSQYVGGEKGYIHATNAAKSFFMYGFDNLTRICYRYGSRIANGWKVTAFEDKNKNHKLDNGEVEIVLVADKKCTTPEWVEINDIYLENPVVTFYNISYIEKEDRVTTSGPHDAYLFNLELYGIANTTDALNTLEVGNKAVVDGKEVTGGEVWIDPYTLCLPTDEELNQFRNSTDRPVEGLEHYQTPRRKMQFNEGTEVKITALPEVGFDFVKWTDEDGNTVSTKNPYTFAIHDDVKYIANYRQIGHIYYTFGSQNLEGSLPAEQQTNKQQFTVHQNRTIANSQGQTLAYWINALDPTAEKKAEGVTQAHYVPTKTYTYSEDDDHFTGFDVYLEPVFLDNSFTLLDIEEPVSVKWPFGYKGGAPEFNIEQRTGFEVAQAYLNADQFIDLRMNIDCTKQPNGKYGKLNNAGRTDDAAQVNQNSVFTFPMTKGMKLEVNTDKSLTASLVGGSKPFSSGKTSVFYPNKKDQGSDWIGGNEVGTTQLYVNDGNQNFSSIVATYYPRLKKPIVKLAGTPTTSATINISVEKTSGANNETIYYSVSTDGRMPADPVINDTYKLPGGNGSVTQSFVGNKPIIIKAVNIADNRPDSKITTYAVLPYDADKNTAVYLYDGKDKNYDMGTDPVFREMMMESVGNYNMVAYDINSGSPTGDAATIVQGEKVKAYVVSDVDKSKANVSTIVGGKQMVSLQTVIDNTNFAWDDTKTSFALKDAANQNDLAIFDKALLSYDNRICISNTGGLRHSDVNYNAAYILANATNAVVDGTFSASDWTTEKTTEPQVRQQIFARQQVSAEGLGLLSSGETNYPVPVWSDAINVDAQVEVGTGYLKFVQPTSGSMDAEVQLYRDEAMTELIRKYVIHLIIGTKLDGLVYTDVDNGSAEEGWNNGTWNVRQDGKAMGGNDGECFKFNTPTRLTITGPANYGIKSVTFHGYDFVGAAAGGGQISGFTAANVDGSPSRFTSMETSTIKKYNNNEYQQHVDGDLKLIYPLGSTNSTTIDLSGANQYIGSIIVEYYERMTSEISITGADFGGNDFANLTMPHNGHFSLTFNSQMAAVTTSQENKVQISDGVTSQAIPAAGDNSMLTFYYWGLNPGDYTLTVPYAALEDIYNTPFTGVGMDEAGLGSYVQDNVLTIPFTVAPMNYERKAMDFIVDDVENGITWDGSHIKALETLGDVNDGNRHVIYLPNRTEANRYFIAANGTRFTDANSRTRLSSSNLSIVGESQNGVIWANRPAAEGSSSTPTLEFMEKANKDNYMQDITIRNEWPYNASNFAGRATCLLDNGTNTILKNVKMDSWQDSYYTQGVNGYNEDCTFMGVVDFIYGHGNYWFQNCDIIVRDRVGNNITAANTSAGEKWGYVFMDCKIDKEEGASLVADGTFTLGRPWNNSPAVSFINTTMYVKPTNAGWQQMETGIGKVLRLHEFNSLNPDGTPISLAGRSVAGMSPAAGSFAAVMTEAQAAEYTLHNVLGGDNGFDPTEHTKQIDRIEDAYIDGQTIYWNDDETARCYNIYYLGDGETADMENAILIANITDSHYNLFNDRVFRTRDAFSTWYDALSKSDGKIRKRYDNFTHGWFGIRAANQRGGLNQISNIVEYHEARTYNAVVSGAGKAAGDNSGNVWSTIYLDFQAAVPAGVKAYALTAVAAYGGTDVTETTVKLTHVSNNVSTEDEQDVILKNQGYVLYGYGPRGLETSVVYEFVETGRPTGVDSQGKAIQSALSGTIGVLKNGEPEGSPNASSYGDMPVGYTNAYTFAAKTTAGTNFGLGFYRFTGTNFSHHKAYLDTDEALKLLLASGLDKIAAEQAMSKGFRIAIYDDDDVTGILNVRDDEITDLSDDIYDVQGRKIRPEQMRKGQVYIIGGKKYLHQ